MAQQQANPEALARLKAAMGKTSKLMQLDKSGRLDAIAHGKRDSINESLNSVDTKPTNIKSMVTSTPTMTAPMMRRSGSMNSNVPAAIRESFQKNQIDDSALYGMSTDLGMITDELGLTQTSKPAVQEAVQPIQQTVTPASQIDYPMIRTIVEDIVRKYAQSLNKKIMNEGKGNELNTLTLGNSFKFLAKNGDIYEAKLTKIGNIKQKKQLD